MPPRVIGKKKPAASKCKAKPWHRHLPWLIPVGACVALVVLIAGVVGVRQLIIVLKRSGPAVAESETVGDSTAASSGAAAESFVEAGQEISLKSSEPDLEVLLPPILVLIRLRATKLAKKLD